MDRISRGATNNWLFANVTSNHTIDASFAIDTYTLAVTSIYGSPSPAGVTTHSWNTVLAPSMTGSPTQIGPGARQVCTGYVGTGSAASGQGTAVTPFSITQDSGITWRWVPTWLLDTSAGAGGSVDTGDAWYTNGVIVTIRANPLPGWGFAGWAGDVPPAQANANPVSLTMDQARTIQATFSTSVGSIRVDITPSTVLPDGAEWRLVSAPDTSWHASGVTVGNLPVLPTYTVRFRALANWDKPTEVTGITVTNGAITVVAGTYAVSGMVIVPGGTFEMGRYNGEGGYTVTLSDYCLDRRAVTVGEYEAFAAATARSMPAAPPWGWANKSRPMVNVTYWEASAYAAWAGKRLPTEAEFEYAMRSGLADALYPWGDAIAPTDANYAVNVGNPSLAGSYPTNTYGVFDIAGNVWEWCADWYGSLQDSVTNPTGPATGTHRIIRSGSWASFPLDLRCALRYYTTQGVRYSTLGFRCASTVGDVDADGLPDRWEWRYFGTVTGVRPNADADADGFSNLEEQVAKTEPDDATSVFRIISAEPLANGEGVVIRWPSAAGRVYTLERVRELNGGFAPVATRMPATPPLNTYIDPIAARGPRYYRIKVALE